MNLFNRKVHLFCVSNIMVSFMCTSFLGVNYTENHEMPVQENSELILASSDTEPASRIGEEKTNETTVTEKKQEEKKNTTTKKNSTVTKVVTKKEVKNSVSYAPAKYSEVTGNAVVEYAKKYLGLRYVSGGNSLTSGTDCSGFTKLIYKEFGVTLSRSAKGQSGNGSYVRKSDLQKGDLVFYGNGNGKISHVGIYIGGGKVLHESNHRDGVKISTVNMMQYITARRVINSNSVKIVEQKLAETNNNTVLEETKNDSVVTDQSINSNVESNVQEKIENNQENKASVSEVEKNNESNVQEKIENNQENTASVSEVEKNNTIASTENSTKNEEKVIDNSTKEETTKKESTSEIKEESKKVEVKEETKVSNESENQQ